MYWQVTFIRLSQSGLHGLTKCYTTLILAYIYRCTMLSM